jgi:hypothetical protein
MASAPTAKRGNSVEPCVFIFVVIFLVVYMCTPRPRESQLGRMVGQGPHWRGGRRGGTRRGGARGSRLADEAVQPPVPVFVISPDALWRGTLLMKPGDFLCLAGEAHRTGRQWRARLEIHAQKVEATRDAANPAQQPCGRCRKGSRPRGLRPGHSRPHACVGSGGCVGCGEWVAVSHGGMVSERGGGGARGEPAPPRILGQAAADSR